jgi:hypothetical protein
MQPCNVFIWPSSQGAVRTAVNRWASGLIHRLCVQRSLIDNMADWQPASGGDTNPYCIEARLGCDWPARAVLASLHTRASRARMAASFQGRGPALRCPSSLSVDFGRRLLSS